MIDFFYPVLEIIWLRDLHDLFVILMSLLPGKILLRLESPSLMLKTSS